MFQSSHFDYKLYINAILHQNAPPPPDLNYLISQSSKLQSSLYDISQQLTWHNEQLQLSDGDVNRIYADCNAIEEDIDRLLMSIDSVDNKQDDIINNIINLDRTETNINNSMKVVKCISNFNSKIVLIIDLYNSKDFMRISNELSELKKSYTYLKNNNIDFSILFNNNNIYHDVMHLNTNTDKDKDIKSPNKLKSPTSPLPSSTVAIKELSGELKALNIVNMLEDKLLDMIKPLLIPSLFNESYNEIRSIISMFINLKLEKAIIDEFINSRVILYEASSMFKRSKLCSTFDEIKLLLEAKFSDSPTSPKVNAILPTLEENVKVNILNLSNYFENYFKDCIQKFDSDIRLFSSITLDYTDFAEFKIIPLLLFDRLLSVVQSVLLHSVYYYVNEVDENVDLVMIFDLISYTSKFIHDGLEIIGIHDDSLLKFAVNFGAKKIPASHFWIGAMSLPFQPLLGILPQLFVKKASNSLFTNMKLKLDNDFILLLYKSTKNLFSELLPQFLENINHFNIHKSATSAIFYFLFKKYYTKILSVVKASKLEKKEESEFSCLLSLYFLCFNSSSQLINFENTLEELYDSIESECILSFESLDALFIDPIEHSLYYNADLGENSHISLSNENIHSSLLLCFQKMKYTTNGDSFILAETIDLSKKFVSNLESTVIDALVQPLLQSADLVNFSTTVWKSFQVESSEFQDPEYMSPTESITTIGEYLFSSVQKLETITSSSLHADLIIGADKLAVTYWLSKITEIIWAIINKNLKSCTFLNTQGKNQINVDLVYLHNVMSALGVNADSPFQSAKNELSKF